MKKQELAHPCMEFVEAWIFLENVDKVPDMSTEEKEVRKAEGSFDYSISLFTDVTSLWWNAMG